MLSPLDFSTSIYTLCRIAAEAGNHILDKAGSSITVQDKADGTPVTEIDCAVEQYLMNEIRVLFPDYPIVSEETEPDQWPDCGDTPFFLIDPLDGTREFLAGRPDYTVNIALIENKKPVLGIIHAPAFGETYGGAAGQGAWRASLAQGIIPEVHDFYPIKTRKYAETSSYIAYASRSHRDEKTAHFLAQALKGAALPFPKIDRVEILGSSLKFVRIAEGNGDFYPRLGQTKEWDTAAGHAILEAAGGTMTTLSGTPFFYGKKAQLFTNEGFIAQG